MVATSPNASSLAYSRLDSERDNHKKNLEQLSWIQDTGLWSTTVLQCSVSGQGFIQSYLPTHPQVFPYAPIFPCPVIVREQL